MKASPKQKGEQLFIMGQVEMEAFRFPKFYFCIRPVNREPRRISYDLSTYKFSLCECKHEIYRQFEDEEDTCYHIEAARSWLKEKGQKFLNEQKIQKRLEI